MDYDEWQRYRREQEDAVSNQSGSGPADVFFAILPNVCSVLMTLTLTELFSPMSRLSRIAIEFAGTVIPCVLCCTILSESTLAISQIFLILSAGNILSILGFKPTSNFKIGSTPSSQRIPFITNFRALTMLITVVCILAVDFTCFPRKFAKTESYGYSLMDTGVGLFIVTNALVATEAKQVRASREPFSEGLARTLKGSLPLLALGIGRAIAVEILGYQKHVTEYGVHWNFFLTLACVKLFTGLLSKSLSSKYSLLTGLWILLMHEYALSTKGLKEWVLSDEPRRDFLSANREGWVSIPGYVGLYLISVGIGRLIHSTYRTAEDQLVFRVRLWSYEFPVGYTRSIYLACKLFVIAFVAIIATHYCEHYVRVSRRLANSGYCAWIILLSTLLLVSLLLIDVFLDSIVSCIREKIRRKKAKHLPRDNLNAEQSVQIERTLEIFEAVNDKGLHFFLFANLLTGAINMSMKTLRAYEPEALAIIITYVAVNIIFVLLRYNGTRILANT